jgi:hypothetical protein
MTLAKCCARLICLLSWVFWLAVAPRSEALLQHSGRRYGPTTPGGYYVRVAPSSITMAHTQRPQVTVTVENAAGQPVDNVLVRFALSEGAMMTDADQTRDGTLIGTFTAATGSDSPRTAFVTVTVENVEVTVFIDIVPAVFGR